MEIEESKKCSLIITIMVFLVLSTRYDGVIQLLLLFLLKKKLLIYPAVSNECDMYFNIFYN